MSWPHPGGNVLLYRAVEQEDILADQANAGPQIPQFELPQVNAVQGSRSRLNFV